MKPSPCQMTRAESPTCAAISLIKYSVLLLASKSIVAAAWDEVAGNQGTLTLK
jgi:hypothetical protein